MMDLYCPNPPEDMQLDHYFRNGVGGRSFVLPPKIKSKEEIPEMVAGFESSLVEMIPQRLFPLLQREATLQLYYKSFNKIIKDSHYKRKISDFELYFWSMFSEYQFMETEYIRAWYKYWLRLYEVAANKKILMEFDDSQPITEEEISQAKSVPIENFYEGDLRLTGPQRLVGRCPFHDEKTASFTIFQDQNTYYCFGCHVWGDVIDFVTKTRNTNLVQAVRELLNE